ncbi:MAG: energy transducer TonB [Proteobacteria bacterium]|nr:energy transducer TonB [Pseudomonadota bacterium]
MAKPIVATTSLSFLFHGLAFAAMALIYDQVVSQDEGVGSGVEIQLVSSTVVSDQQEVDVPRNQKVLAEASPESLVQKPEKKLAENILTSLNSVRAIVDTESEKKGIFVQASITDESESLSSIVQSTNASQQQHAILELLHRRISDKKEYPYMARRQRREGVATVAFVLHPDGKIENAHLVSSSHAVVLDRAALSAVKNIEPFLVAGEYIKQSEEFQVDVAFKLF